MDSGETITCFTKEIDCNAKKLYCPSKLSDKIQWYQFKDSLINTLYNYTKKPNDVLL